MLTQTVATATTEADTGAEGGLVLKDEQGALYFIRDSFLEALRIKGDGLERMTALLNGNGGAAGGRGFQIVDRVQRDEIEGIVPQNPEEMGEFQSLVLPPVTVMCPWFC
ncbi:hypothetical protein [Actinomadura rupiterrae]|uniref:hypothetical protein n=1 Tax=Actinomadura rupiterrae TaxID=559627 RepID=UPI0020A23DF1|nr:hypothetical protein [Actinomadura rupiterrae]MCP2336567.1 hypothetical protein [Actinomadura rupiterrae]